MKQLINNKWVTLVIGVIIGGASIFGWHAWTTQKEISKRQIISSQFDEKFFSGGADPFAEAERMHQQMLKRFPGMRGLFDYDDGKEEQGHSFFGSKPLNSFDRWLKSSPFGRGTKSDEGTADLGSGIKTREDDKNIYYDIPISGLKDEKVNVRVQDGQITVSGRIEKKESDDGSGGKMQSFVSSSFHQSFPVPEGVDANKVQMNQEKDKITLAFPKVHS